MPMTDSPTPAAIQEVIGILRRSGGDPSDIAVAAVLESMLPLYSYAFYAKHPDPGVTPDSGTGLSDNVQQRNR